MAKASNTRNLCVCLTKGGVRSLTMMSLGTKLTGYLLLGVLVVMGLELYLSVKRIQTDLLHDVRREVAAISRTLHLAVTLIERTDAPGCILPPSSPA